MDESVATRPPLRDLPVFDVDGRRLGRVIAEGESAFSVELTPVMELRLDAPSRVVRIPLDAIVDADDHEVTLRETGQFVVHPEQVPRDPVD